VNVRIGSIPGEAPNPLPSHLRHAFRPLIVGLRIVINCIVIIIIIIFIILLLLSTPGSQRVDSKG